MFESSKAHQRLLLTLWYIICMYVSGPPKQSRSVFLNPLASFHALCRSLGFQSRKARVYHQWSIKQSVNLCFFQHRTFRKQWSLSEQSIWKVESAQVKIVALQSSSSALPSQKYSKTFNIKWKMIYEKLHSAVAVTRNSFPLYLNSNSIRDALKMPSIRSSFFNINLNFSIFLVDPVDCCVLCAVWHV